MQSPQTAGFRKRSILDQVVVWLQSEPAIRAATLVGSRAEKTQTDDLSDDGISLFCYNASSFMQTKNWLEEIAVIPDEPEITEPEWFEIDSFVESDPKSPHSEPFLAVELSPSFS